MQRFKNILVHVHVESEDHPALERAAQLAKNNNAVLRAVAVQKELPNWVRTMLPSKVSDCEQTDEMEIRQRLEKLVVPIRDSGVEISSTVLVGESFIEIIREVLRNSHDLVLKGLDVDDDSEKLAIGTADMRLFRKCPCPVWLVKPASPRRFERIMAAVDPEPGDDVRKALNVEILELATSLSELEGGQLYILRAWDTMREAFVAHKLSMAEEYVRRLEMARQDAVRELMAPFETDAGRFHVLHIKGMPEAVIPQVAKEKKVGLVVMGTVARAGIPGLLMGSTAEKVLRKLNCSILAVKPEGFVSPVTLQ